MPNSNQVFEAAHAHVMKWEGGFFDHPADTGGITNYGVSLMFLKSLGLYEGDVTGDGQIDRNDVLAMTKDNAKGLFKRHFWNSVHADEFPPLIAVAFYDLAVNAGVYRSTKILQEALNVSSDGIIGNETQTALATCNQQATVHKMLKLRGQWYCELANKKSSARIFLQGWIHRTEDCKKLVRKLTWEWQLCGK